MYSNEGTQPEALVYHETPKLKIEKAHNQKGAKASS